MAVHNGWKEGIKRMIVGGGLVRVRVRVLKKVHQLKIYKKTQHSNTSITAPSLSTHPQTRTLALEPKQLHSPLLMTWKVQNPP